MSAKKEEPTTEDKKGETLIISQDFMAKKKPEVVAMAQEKVSTGALGSLGRATSFATTTLNGFAN